MDWKNEAKAARERVAFLVDQTMKLLERVNAGDLLCSQLEKYGLPKEDNFPLLSREAAEAAVIKGYHRKVAEVDNKIEHLY